MSEAVIRGSVTDRVVVAASHRVDEGSARQATAFGTSATLAERTALALAIQVAERGADKGALDGAYTVHVEIVPHDEGEWH